jgi:hypothetical protein
MADSLAYSGKPHACVLPLNTDQFFCRYSLAFVLNIQGNGLRFAHNPYCRLFAAGMAMNIGETFLHNTKQRHFHLAGKPAKALRDAQLDLQIAAPLQTLYVPTNRFGQTILVKKRRMQQIGRCPYLFAQLLNKFPAVFNPFGKLWIVCYTLTDVSKTQLDS